MTTKTTAEILRDAKGILERNGWFQGGYFDGEQRKSGTALEACRVCLYGAINMAAGNIPSRPLEANHPAMVAVYEIVDAQDPDGDGIGGWNDLEGRTVDEVFALLDEAIECAEAGASR